MINIKILAGSFEQGVRRLNRAFSSTIVETSTFEESCLSEEEISNKNESSESENEETAESILLAAKIQPFVSEKNAGNSSHSMNCLIADKFKF